MNQVFVHKKFGANLTFKVKIIAGFREESFDFAESDCCYVLIFIFTGFRFHDIIEVLLQNTFIRILSN